MEERKVVIPDKFAYDNYRVLYDSGAVTDPVELATLGNAIHEYELSNGIVVVNDMQEDNNKEEKEDNVHTR